VDNKSKGLPVKGLHVLIGCGGGGRWRKWIGEYVHVIFIISPSANTHKEIVLLFLSFIYLFSNFVEYEVNVHTCCNI